VSGSIGARGHLEEQGYEIELGRGRVPSQLNGTFGCMESLSFIKENRKRKKKKKKSSNRREVPCSSFRRFVSLLEMRKRGKASCRIRKKGESKGFVPSRAKRPRYKGENGFRVGSWSKL